MNTRSRTAAGQPPPLTTAAGTGGPAAGRGGGRSGGRVGGRSQGRAGANSTLVDQDPSPNNNLEAEVIEESQSHVGEENTQPTFQEQQPHYWNQGALKI